jgi:predicted MFS family arabinose efflux permease
VLTETVGWRAIFWINLPIGIAAVVLTALFVPESRAPRARRVDAVGQLLVIVALASLTYAIIEAPQAGWTAATTLGLFALSFLAVGMLLAYEPHRIDPLLELRFFRSAPFSGATVIAVCAFGGFSGFLFLNTLYLQEVRGLSALQAGLCTLPLAVMTLIFAPLSGRLVGSQGPRIPLLAAGASMCAGALMLVGLAPDTSLSWVLASYVVFGLGFGLVNAPITNTALSGMPRSQAGVAAAIASTSRQVGAALGVAVVGSVLSSGLSGSLATGFVGASHAAWWIVAGCGLAVLGIGALTSGTWAVGTTTRTADLFEEDD